MKFKYLIYAAELSFLYNIVILVSVALNLDWVRTRAAGGQFESFPSTLRILYLLMALLMAYLAPLLWVHREKQLPERDMRFARLISYTFAVSTFLQLISRSSDERWNAVPAIIIAIAFFKLSRRKN